MNAKRFAWGLMSLLVALSHASAQTTLAPPLPPMESLIDATTGSPAATPPSAPISGIPQPVPTVVSVPAASPGFSSDGYSVPGVSSWVRRNTPCCNGPFGRDPEIGSELYIRSGPSIPIGDGPRLSRNLATGITGQFGLRTLFYNHEYTAAWTIDGGMSDTHNSGVRNGDVFIVPGINNTKVPITVRDVNRTFVNLGGGREWFYRPAKDNPAGWRFGIDGGGRWGSMKASPANITHLTDVVGGVYAGGHVMYECVVWDSIVNFGLRTEYSYTWSDVFRQQSDISEINILFNVGVRY